MMKRNMCSDDDGRSGKFLTLARLSIADILNQDHSCNIFAPLTGFRKRLHIWDDVTLEVSR